MYPTERIYLAASQMWKHWISLIRWPNLLLLGAVQLIVYGRLVNAANAVMDAWGVSMLILTTMLIAAAGYTINDIEDVAIDQVNKPSRWIVGKHITVQQAMLYYKVLFLAGACIALLFAIRYGLILYFPVYVLAIVGLQLYSTHFKCRPILGNVWVSVFCAGAVGIMGLPDILLGRSDIIDPTFWFYAGFAFLTTWYREMVKDLEDYAGDQQQGCKTFVVRYGMQKGKIFTLIIALFLTGVLLWWETQVNQPYMRMAIWLCQGCVVAASALIWWPRDPSYYHKASTVIKIMMAIGTLMLLLPPGM
jgi:4-hydroxybenzoate polyprenyltransferase